MLIDATLLLLLLAPVTAVGVRAAQNAKEAAKARPSKTDFLQQLSASPNADDTAYYLLDVGANDGAWSAHMAKACRAAAPSRPAPKLIIFEPQHAFRNGLAALAAQYNGSFMPAAAWVEDAKLSMNVRKDSRASTVSAATSSSDTSNDVPAIDLAAYMLRTLPPRTDSSLVYLHMDIEGAEYTLLPRLLLSGALCLVTHMHIEWHLPSLAAAPQAPPSLVNESARAIEAGVGLRLSLHQLLKKGCPRKSSSSSSSGRAPPVDVVIDHEEMGGASQSYRLAARAVYEAYERPIVK